MTIPHALDQNEAIDRMKKESESAIASFGDQVKNIQQSWSNNRVDFSFSAMSFSIEGDMQVNHDNIALNATLPLAAIMFKGMIEQRLRERLGEVLA